MYNPHHHQALATQIRRQQKHAWDIDRDIPWQQSIDLSRPLLPLDHDAVAFPGASAEQRLALSQLMGLLINSTIAEMEGVIHKLRDTAWVSILRSYPVNPEMWELGELFFIEELKHSLAFYRYNTQFCQSAGIDPEDLDRILPKAFGSMFLRATQANARAGGHAFWWVVASVEEVSIELYQQINGHKANIEPLFFAVHRRHMEEEVRHHNYAFLMLDLIHRNTSTINRLFHRKIDLLLGQVFSSAWVVSELSKVMDSKKLAHKHPFFGTIASCIPLFKSLSAYELAKRLFVSAPYVSLMLNTKNHHKTTKFSEKFHAISFPFPKPKDPEFGEDE